MEEISELALRKLELFSNVSTSTLEILTQKGHLECYKAGKHLFHDRDELHCFYIVVSGTASLYKTNENGQNKTIFILDEGHLLNEVIFEDLPSSINCKAFTPCTVLVFYKKDLLELMKEDFILTQNIMNALSKRIRRLYRQLKNSTSVTKIEKKLAAKLWKLGRDYGVPCEQGTLIDFNITVTSLGDLLGSYRETISRALKMLTEKDLIIYQGKRIIIPNPDKLAKFFKTL